ncbi:N-acetyl-ornithine/N-acetyl-lysine deacetylase [Pyrolobus fumarii 1A]|uniref:Putative [LysW]-lysine/[LysW]-ornithine hydrolase n=1 Tax=Pyrolobus fumarii (strain DSM 11204 / 1A) TaxID=694429 RepID=G0ECM2_PYRF1|nr:N-acetyl-lysine deacetylase [Pyrolobus fumarii]AEM39592.1 N-acetyl-ornithine/N-acetyl-lysine deacetylase [Pyrolobus fumarii 1A]
MEARLPSLERIVEHLRRLVEVYAPTGEEERLHPVLREIAEELGADYVIDEVGNFFIVSGDGHPNIVLVSHLDTVPGELPVRVEGTTVWGRGAVDARAPLLAMVYAAALYKGPCTVWGGGVVAEEGDSRGAWHLVRKGVKPDYIIIGEPSGTTGVVIGYRGSAPSRVVCRGRGGHGASPWDADSALEKLIDYYVSLRNRSGRSFNEITAVATIIRAGDYPNKLPEEAVAHLDVRVPPGKSIEDVRAFLEEGLPRDCRVEVLGYTPGIRVRPNDPVPRALIRGLIREGAKPRILLKHGTSDMNILAQVARSIAAYGPGDSRLAHSTEERVDAKEVLLATRVLIHAIRELCETLRRRQTRHS